MAEQYKQLPDTVKAVVFGRTSDQWAAVIGEVTVYAPTVEDSNSLNKARAEERGLSVYPYGNGEALGRISLKPFVPGKYLNILFPPSGSHVEVVVTDLTNPDQLILPHIPVSRDLFFGYDLKTNPRSSLILDAPTSQILYEIQERKTNA